MKLHVLALAIAVSATTSSAPTPGPTRTAAGPYLAVTDRNAYAKPALPSLGPAGSTIVDPVFQSTILRVTDANTRPSHLGVSYRSPSSPHQNAWSANGSYFYVVSDDGTAIPFAFNSTTGAASRITPSTTGPGGFVLNFYIEPQFSYLNDSIIYGSVSSGNLHTIDQYDFSAGVYSRILDLETIVSGLPGTYIGGVASSAGASERIMAMFGGTSQDHHHLIIVFDRGNPANYQIVDTWASTLNGAPTSSILNFSLHGAAIDRSGRYLMLYPTNADMSGPRKAPQSIAWDTQTGTFTEMPLAAHPYGHDSFGYGVSVNQDCCVNTPYDGVQWQFRNLSMPMTSRDVLPQVLTPQEVYISDHSTWNNARSDQLVPYVSGLFRYGTSNTTPWRALDDEIVAVETDVPGQNPTIWRFAHHRSDVADDTNASNTSFWYEPRPNVSDDGRWVMFTSNWEKTLGTDPAGDTGSGFRQDVFIVQLAPASSASTPPPAPPVVPVAITTTTLPSGPASVTYSATLQASGGSGTYTWSVLSGSLPVGLSLTPSTGAISGIPQSAATTSVTIAVADATNATNTASAAYTIAISGGAVRITTTTLAAGRAKIAYSATESAVGGSGSFTWSVASGALPTGLALNPATGAITGTPTTAGTYAVTIAATDVTDATNATTAAYSLLIAADVKITSPRTLPNATLGVFYSYQVIASHVEGTAVWNMQGNSLPPGMTLNATTGVISGTCTTPGTWYFNVRVIDVNTNNTLTLGLTVQ